MKKISLIIAAVSLFATAAQAQAVKSEGKVVPTAVVKTDAKAASAVAKTEVKTEVKDDAKVAEAKTEAKTPKKAKKAKKAEVKAEEAVAPVAVEAPAKK